MKRFSQILPLMAAAMIIVAVSYSCRETSQEPELSLSAQMIRLPQSGGWVDFIVYTNVDWTLDNPEGYDIVPVSGSGSSSVRLTVNENPNLGTELEGSFSIKAGVLSQTVQVVQAGIPPYLEVTQTLLENDYRGGVYRIGITSNMPWEAHSGEAWCSLSPETGNGDGVLEISCEENTGLQTRSAVISVYNISLNIKRDITLTQTGFVANDRMLDSLALAEFFLLTNGETWTKNRWDLLAPMHTWEGIRLNRQGRVDSLSIASGVITLPGPVPSCLGRLAALEYLTLNGNGFTGTLPESLGDLTALKRLSITSNPGITGPFPSWIGKLESMERLSFSSMTGLTGQLPEALFELTNLTDLNLVGCTGLEGPIPAGIGNLTLLTNLQMSNVPFSGTLPKEMGQLTALRNLGLYNTKLELPIPDEFFTLKNLASVLFQQNTRFEGPLPEGFGHMTTTSDRLSIRLESCNFTGSIPEAWANIPDVTSQLRIQGNKLSGTIPSVVKQHTCWTQTIWNPALYICPQQPGYGFDNCD